MPLTFVEKLALYLTHPGISLCLRRLTCHHAFHVQILDDQRLKLVDQSRGHLVLDVVPETR